MLFRLPGARLSRSIAPTQNPCMTAITPNSANAGAGFSHIVIIWTDPAVSTAAEELVAGAERYLRGIPGIVNFYVGKMVPSPRAVVDQSYQVGLNATFATKQAHDAYQVHPHHAEFVEKVLKRVCQRIVVYDFE